MADPDLKRHASIKRTTKTKAAVLVLLALSLLFVSLGNWQLHRAQERREISAQIEAGRSSAPITITSQSTLSTLPAWQRASVRGSWLPQRSLLLDNRNLDGKPGLWLATPLKLDETMAILVLRGWVARPIGVYNALPKIDQSTHPVELSGELLSRVPQLYQIAQEPPLADQPVYEPETQDGLSSIDLSRLPRRQNVALTDLERWAGINFAPIVLLQTSSTNNDTLVRQWPEPSVDADKNIGYAMQWFSFAAIAIGAMGVLLWRTRTRAKIPTIPKK